MSPRLFVAFWLAVLGVNLAIWVAVAFVAAHYLSKTW